MIGLIGEHAKPGQLTTDEITDSVTTIFVRGRSRRLRIPSTPAINIQPPHMGDEH